MTQYSGWQAPFLSFWSASFYQEVGKVWGGLGYLYLLLLTAFVGLVFSLEIQMHEVPFLQDYLDKTVDKLPEIKIENGKLSIDKPSPYSVGLPSISHSESQEPMTILFDTRQKPVDIKNSSSPILVTSDTVFFKDRVQTRQYDLSKIDHFALNKTEAKEKIGLLKWLGLLAFVIYLVISFLVCVFQTIIYGLMGKLMAGQSQLGFATLIRLATVAMTPVILLNLIFKLTSVCVPFWWLISIVITLGYLYYAVDANKTISA